MNLNTNSNQSVKQGTIRSQPGAINPPDLNESNSEETVYKSAVPQKSRYSSSSDEPALVDTSNEMLNYEFGELNVFAGTIVDGHDDTRCSRKGDEQRHGGYQRDRAGSPSPSTSSGNRGQSPGVSRLPEARRLTPEEKAARLTRDAENAKARMLPATGKNTVFFNNQPSVFIDETFIVVSSHVDINTIERIQKGEYVDFGKLIPRDRVLVEEDQRLEMIIRNSKTFYVHCG